MINWELGHHKPALCPRGIFGMTPMNAEHKADGQERVHQEDKQNPEIAI